MIDLLLKKLTLLELEVDDQILDLCEEIREAIVSMEEK